MIKQRKIPLRRCTGCGEMKNKKELIRVVRSNEGQFFIDFTGKKPGRGAYVCKEDACLERSVKQRGLERSFKLSVPKDLYEQLKAELEGSGKA